MPALPAAAPTRGDGSAATHAEKVTLSEEGRQAKRELGPVPRGNVRWYRAAALPLPSRPTPPTDSMPARAMHSGVAAYRRAMAYAAA